MKMIEMYNGYKNTLGFECFKPHGFVQGNLIEFKKDSEPFVRYGVFDRFEIFRGKPILYAGRHGVELEEIESIAVHAFPWCFWALGRAKIYDLVAYTKDIEQYQIIREHYLPGSLTPYMDVYNAPFWIHS